MRKKWPEGGCRTPPSPFVNETSLWLLERGLCDPETAAEYVGRKLLSPEAFAQARKEYQRATGNSSDRRRYHSSFAARKTDAQGSRRLLRCAGDGAGLWPTGQATIRCMSALVFGEDVELRPHTIDRYGRNGVCRWH